MIYTLTLNPSLDYTVRLNESLRMGEVNRTAGEYYTPGGKGISCAVMLKRLGQEVTALGFAGGFTGDIVEDSLRGEGVNCALTRTSSSTRINVKIDYDRTTEINAAGERITEGEWALMEKSLSQVSPGDHLTLSGSLPRGVDEGVYGELMEKTIAENVYVTVDAPGTVVRRCLRYRPFLVKPNIYELEEIFGCSVTGIESIAEKAKELCRMGAHSALVSLGGDGALLCIEGKKIYTVPAVPVDVINTVGCGDSMVAGYLSAYINTGDPCVALRLANAAGSATASTVGLASGEEAERLFEISQGTVVPYGEV